MTPYREKVLISGQGTASQPLRLCGISGPNGQLPVLSGDGAVTDPFLEFGNWRPQEDLGLVTIYNPVWERSPVHVVVEGLAVQNVSPEYVYTASDATQRPFVRGAAGIWIQHGENLTLRGNEISDCDNGVVVQSLPGSAETITRSILIERNEFANNGIVDSFEGHNAANYGIGVVYQFNRFGRLRAGATGVNLLDRGAGVVVRYNRFEGGNGIVSIVEPHANAPTVLEAAYLALVGENVDDDRLAAVRAAETQYRESYVYGNLMHLVGSLDGDHVIRYGWDAIEQYARQGTLWVFHNTVVIESDAAAHPSVRLLDVSSVEEIVEFVNNIALTKSETVGSTPSLLSLARQSGRVGLGANLLTAGWVSADQQNTATIEGVDNLLSSSDPISATVGTTDYLPTASSVALDGARPIPVGLADHPVRQQYREVADGEERPVCGDRSDLGAKERC